MRGEWYGQRGVLCECQFCSVFSVQQPDSLMEKAVPQSACA